MRENVFDEEATRYVGDGLKKSSLAIRFLLALLFAFPGFSAAQTEVNQLDHPEIGYIPMKDGVKLAYILRRPSQDRPFPVLVKYEGYVGGGTDLGVEEADYLKHGYAVLEVSMRGTGCSEGVFHSEWESPQAEDGAQVIEWAGTQLWSDGNVGMFGNSWGGDSQLLVGALRPKHLKAVAAGGTDSDAYADGAYQGGIFSFAGLAEWTFITQPSTAAVGARFREQLGDQDCAAHRSKQLPAGDSFEAVRAHPLRDPLWSRMDLLDRADRITAPVMLIQGWQDEASGSRGPGRVFERIKAPKKLIWTNGSHASYHLRPMREQRIRWYDHWLKGLQNGIDKESPVTIWFETKVQAHETRPSWEWDVRGLQHDPRRQQNFEATPSWEWNFPNWPIPGTQWSSLYLTANGKLSEQKPEVGEESGIRAYVYPAATELISDNASFATRPAPVGSLTYRSAPTPQDMTVIGSPLLTLYFSAEQRDTDFMVALHEVRPDGKVEYLQCGFLRASHRNIDPKQSTLHNPFLPHNKLEDLVPGKVYQVQIQLKPLGFVLRQGDVLELAIMAPPAVPQPPSEWGFALVMLPGVNTVYQSASYPSRLELPVVPGHSAEAAAPPCGSLPNQPCRQEAAGLANQVRYVDHVFQALGKRQRETSPAQKSAKH